MPAGAPAATRRRTMCDEKKKPCPHPEKLKGGPEDCTPEQIAECHGIDVEHECGPPADCEHPERLRGRRPGECSPAQKRECHGE
jgi:hypothetical protein